MHLVSKSASDIVFVVNQWDIRCTSPRCETTLDEVMRLSMKCLHGIKETGPGTTLAGRRILLCSNDLDVQSLTSYLDLVNEQ